MLFPLLDLLAVLSFVSSDVYCTHSFVSLLFLSLPAQAATRKIYQPLIIGVNLLWLLLVFGKRSSFGYAAIFAQLITFGLQYYAYVGILEAAANATHNKKDELVGGRHLDLLGLTIVVQFLAVLHSTKWYWVLVAVPIYAGWSLYQSVYGGNTATPKQPDIDEDDPAYKAKQERRQQRAQKRKQKWG